MKQDLRVVTLNTWKCDGRYDDRLVWMADGLSELEPDLVCLQEAFACRETGDDSAGFIAERLSMKTEVLRARRKMRIFKGKQHETESNLAVLSSKPMRRAEDLKLVEVEGDRDRWAMQVDVELQPGQKARVINTHFTHLRSKAGDAARRAQAQQVYELCSKSDADITMCCGDLNAEARSASLAPLWELGFVRPLIEDLNGTFHGERQNALHSARRIDFVEIAAKRSNLVTFNRRAPALNEPLGPNDEYPSDHAALLADFAIVPSSLDEMERSR